MKTCSLVLTITAYVLALCCLHVSSGGIGPSGSPSGGYYGDHSQYEYGQPNYGQPDYGYDYYDSPSFPYQCKTDYECVKYLNDTTKPYYCSSKSFITCLYGGYKSGGEYDGYGGYGDYGYGVCVCGECYKDDDCKTCYTCSKGATPSCYTTEHDPKAIYSAAYHSCYCKMSSGR